MIREVENNNELETTKEIEEEIERLENKLKDSHGSEAEKLEREIAELEERLRIVEGNERIKEIEKKNEELGSAEGKMHDKLEEELLELEGELRELEGSLEKEDSFTEDEKKIILTRDALVHFKEAERAARDEKEIKEEGVRVKLIREAKLLKEAYLGDVEKAKEVLNHIKDKKDYDRAVQEIVFAQLKRGDEEGAKETLRLIGEHYHEEESPSSEEVEEKKKEAHETEGEAGDNMHLELLEMQVRKGDLEDAKETLKSIPEGDYYVRGLCSIAKGEARAGKSLEEILSFVPEEAEKDDVAKAISFLQDKN